MKRKEKSSDNILSSIKTPCKEVLEEKYLSRVRK